MNEIKLSNNYKATIRIDGPYILASIVDPDGNEVGDLVSINREGKQRMDVTSTGVHYPNIETLDKRIKHLQAVRECWVEMIRRPGWSPLNNNPLPPLTFKY